MDLFGLEFQFPDINLPALIRAFFKMYFLATPLCRAWRFQKMVLECTEMWYPLNSDQIPIQMK